jgi:hypothetical protein
MSNFNYIMFAYYLPMLFIIVAIQGAYSNPTNWLSIGLGGGLMILWVVIYFILDTLANKNNTKVNKLDVKDGE